MSFCTVNVQNDKQHTLCRQIAKRTFTGQKCILRPLLVSKRPLTDAMHFKKHLLP